MVFQLWYVNLSESIEDFEFKRPANDDLIYRWCVYYIIYNMISDDYKMFNKTHRTNSEDWEEAKDERVFQLISDAYPVLKDACNDIQLDQSIKRDEKKFNI